jgi:hypothetical protein
MKWSSILADIIATILSFIGKRKYKSNYVVQNKREALLRTIEAVSQFTSEEKLLLKDVLEAFPSHVFFCLQKKVKGAILAIFKIRLSVPKFVKIIYERVLFFFGISFNTSPFPKGCAYPPSAV